MLSATSEKPGLAISISKLDNRYWMNFLCFYIYHRLICAFTLNWYADILTSSIFEAYPLNIFLPLYTHAQNRAYAEYSKRWPSAHWAVVPHQTEVPARHWLGASCLWNSEEYISVSQCILLHQSKLTSNYKTTPPQRCLPVTESQTNWLHFKLTYKVSY